VAQMSWSCKARKAVESALKEGAKAGLTGIALRKYVRDRYPFGPRKHYPYQVWLAWVRRLVKAKHGPLTGRRRKGSKPTEMSNERMIT